MNRPATCECMTLPVYALEVEGNMVNIAARVYGGKACEDLKLDSRQIIAIDM